MWQSGNCSGKWLRLNLVKFITILYLCIILPVKTLFGCNMQFKDIYGLEEEKAKLINSVKEGRVAHAQMFAARRGSQNLALALAFAQYCNCTNRTDTDSCGVCPSCKKMAHFVHPDLHFVFPIVKKGDGKETNCSDYMDEWRENLNNLPFSYESWINQIGTENQQGVIYASESEEIVRSLLYSSSESEYKVVILWLPEKMHVACANKLLKLIEEPNGKTLFLLVSDAPDEVLGTIYSRTQTLRLSLLPQQQVEQFLHDRYPEETAENIADAARIANGDLLLGEETLESQSDNKEYFENFVELMRASYSRSAKRMRAWTDVMASMGRKRQISFLDYAQRMVRESFIRNLHLEDQLNYMTAEEMNFTNRFSPFIKENNVIGIVEELQSASRDIEQNVQAKLVFFDLALRMIMLIKQ